MSLTICTVSGKGGTGKSTISLGLAIAAARAGKRVLILDLDSGLRCLDLIFGIEENIVSDLGDALRESDINRAAYKSANYNNIWVVPALLTAEKIDFSKLSSLLKKAKNDYDIIILDFPAGADFDAYNQFGDAVFLIVSGADNVSLRDAAVISNGIRSNNEPRLVINRFDIGMIKIGLNRNIDDTINSSLTRLIGIVPADGELLMLSLNHNLSPNGRAMKAFDRIIRRLSGEDVPLPKLKKI